MTATISYYTQVDGLDISAKASHSNEGNNDAFPWGIHSSSHLSLINSY